MVNRTGTVFSPSIVEKYPESLSHPWLVVDNQIDFLLFLFLWHRELERTGTIILSSCSNSSSYWITNDTKYSTRRSLAYDQFVPTPR